MEAVVLLVRRAAVRAVALLSRRSGAACTALALLTLLACAAKELAPLPEFYFAHKRNFVNVFFVKRAWGWMLLPLVPLVAVTAGGVGGAPQRGGLGPHAARLLVATAVWFVATETFGHLDRITGSCDTGLATAATTATTAAAATAATTTTTTAAAPPAPLAAGDRRECQRLGGSWSGVDISGHAFLLTYCLLLGVEELRGALAFTERQRAHGDGGGRRRGDGGGRRQDDGSRCQDDGGRRQDDGGRRQDDGGRRQDDGGRRQDDGGRPQDDGGHRRDDGGRRRDDGGHRQDDGGRRQDDGGRRQDDGGRRRGDGSETRYRPTCRPAIRPADARWRSSSASSSASSSSSSSASSAASAWRGPAAGDGWPTVVVEALCLPALLALMALWAAALAGTCLYHHEAWHKVAGAAVAYAAWHATYRRWYRGSGWVAPPGGGDGAQRDS
ncbi:uncharacterized protein LOC116937892 [Petromyzon marinus]|uniref:uncharacterized protein LOC116937892 n=1 Tax=Petromyzon marinus TaxID=7757 RepID=UPI003F70E86F